MEGKKILIIDDDPDLIEALEIVFNKEGYHVLKAESGKEGLDILTKEIPDLIVLDVMMETIDEGIKVAREIRKNEKFKNLPIIGLSGINNEFPVEVGPDNELYPVNIFISKPFLPDKFLKEVKRLIK